MRLGEVFPDVKGRASASASLYEKEGKTIIENFSVRQYIAGGWGMFFSHPADFTPVCTTELAEAVLAERRFKALGCKIVGFSCDEAESHVKWSADILRVACACRNGELPFLNSVGLDENGGSGPEESPRERRTEKKKPPLLPFPIVADPSRQMAHRLGIIDPRDEMEAKNCHAAGKPVPPAYSVRSCFFISPEMRIEACILYPAVTGRSFGEILRVLQALQVSINSKFLATPANWLPGKSCIVEPALSDDEVLKMMQDSEKEGGGEQKEGVSRAVKNIAEDVKVQRKSPRSTSPSPGASQKTSETKIEHFPLPSGKGYLRFVRGRDV